MKMNWGYKILLVYILFVIGILFLVYMSSQQKYELVQKNYYADELKYQNIIDASQKAKQLGGEVKAIRSRGKLIVILPMTFNKQLVKGNAHLYYAADEKKDIIKYFQTQNAYFDIGVSPNLYGSYTLKLAVEMKGEQYYYEQKIIF